MDILSIVGVFIGITVTIFMLRHAIKHDKDFAKIVKSLGKIGLFSFLLAFLPTLVYFITIGLILDYIELGKKIKLPEWLILVGILSVVAVFLISWSVIDNFLRKRNNKS
jgi:hypothetical protein